MGSNKNVISQQTLISNKTLVSQKTQDVIKETEISEDEKQIVEKVKDGEKSSDKTLPLYLRPTKAYLNKKKRTPTPIKPPKDPRFQKPPSSQLTRNTAARKNYTSQTKRYNRCEPIWKPPMTAHEFNPRVLPKAHFEIPKLPDFVDGGITKKRKKTNMDVGRNNDSSAYNTLSEAEETDYEYIQPINMTVQLGEALPELYSIVKDYGRRTDLIPIRKRTDNLPIPSVSPLNLSTPDRDSMLSNY